MAKIIMKSFSIRIPEALYDEIDAMAKHNERNMTQEGTRALKAAVAKHQQKQRLQKPN